MIIGLGVLCNSRNHYLEQYARFFNSVEINSTFYQFPKKGQLKKWCDATPDDFVFSVKINKYITTSSGCTTYIGL